MSLELSKSHEDNHDSNPSPEGKEPSQVRKVSLIDDHKRSNRLGGVQPMATRMTAEQSADDLDFGDDPTIPLGKDVVEQVRKRVLDTVIDDIDGEVDVAEDMPNTSDRKSRTIRFALVAVALGLIATSLFMDNEDKISINAPMVAQTPMESQSDGVIQRDDGVTTLTAEVTEPGQLAREIISSSQKSTGLDSSSLEEITSEANDLASAGAQEDAYLLHFFAAKKGKSESAMYLARLADPLSFDPDNGVVQAPAPFDAYRWYSAAADAGASNAKERLGMLKDWALTESGRGNDQAQRLLLQWH